MRSAGWLPDVCGADHIPPDLERDVARSTMLGDSQAMAAGLEVIVNRAGAWRRPIGLSWAGSVCAVGLTQSMLLGIICFGTLRPMLLATVQGLGAVVKPRLREVGRPLRMPPWRW